MSGYADNFSAIGIVWRPEPGVEYEVVSDLSAAAQREQQRQGPNLKEDPGANSRRRVAWEED